MKNLLAEAIAAGLPPEKAAELLLEPSRWDKELFGPSNDLESALRDYTRGESGVGRVYDVAHDLAASADAIAEIAGEVVKHYGTNALPEDVPSEPPEERTTEAEETIILMEPTGKVDAIVEHIADYWPTDLLEQIYGAGLPPDPEQALQDLAKWGPYVGRAADDVATVHRHIEAIDRAYDTQQWADLVAHYEKLREELTALAGDVMVLNDVARAAVDAGLGNRIIAGSYLAGKGAPAPQVGVAEQLRPPPVLDAMLDDQLRDAWTVFSEAHLGQVTYAQLLEITSRMAEPRSPIMRHAQRLDLELPEPEEIARYRLPTAAPAEEPEEIPIAEPAEEPSATATVSEPGLAGIFEPPEQAGRGDVVTRLAQALGIEPGRGQQLADYIQAQGQDPDQLARDVETALQGAVQYSRLGRIRSWRSYQKKEPHRAENVLKAIRNRVRQALQTDQPVEAGELLRNAFRAIRGRPAKV